ncbi:MAG: DUF1501 domain-containing protein [Isosphaera sp.]|nr:DUF1501 domain-containing protein [Isosphaera sp.]
MLTRRQFTAAATAGAFAPWFRTLAAGASAAPPAKQPKACILLWMPGGPSQHDTFDPGPGSNFGSIQSSVPGLEVCEHLPKLAKQMHHLALIRTMDTKDATHDSAVYLLSSGYKKGAGGVRHPHLGSTVAFEFADPAAELPAFVSLSHPYPELDTPGYLGAKWAAFATHPGRGVPDVAPTGTLTAGAVTDRAALLAQLSKEFVSGRPGTAAAAQATTVESASRLMRSSKLRAFDLTLEPEAAHDLYGTTPFAKQCLQARRLVEAGVPFVQVACAPEESKGQGRTYWDTHTETAKVLKDVLLPVLDQPMAALLADLKDRGLLDTTLVVWMGEFGRGKQSVGHNSKNWTAALAGAGVKGGVACGSWAKPDTFRPVGVGDLFATIFTALGIDPAKEHVLKGGRPMSIVDGGGAAKPVEEVLA